MVLAPGFTCSEASHDEQPQLWEMFSKAYAKDEHWKAIMENVVEPEKIQPWILQVFSPLWTLPDKTIYKITENSSGKIVAWTALQHPWRYVDAMTAEMKDHSNSDELPPLLEGMNVEALKEQLKALSGAHELGYDPENDYHRKGTFVHPDFQKRRFGTYLTKLCNGVSDKSGDKTYISCRPASHHMFLTLGFEDKMVVDCKLERWGVTRENSLHYIVLRNPPNK